MYQLFFLFQRLCSFSTNENRWSPWKETIWIFLFDVKLTSASLVVTQIWTLFQRILFLAENRFGCSPYLILIKQWTGINSWKILLKYQAYKRATWLQHYSTKFTALWTFIFFPTYIFLFKTDNKTLEKGVKYGHNFNIFDTFRCCF